MKVAIDAQTTLGQKTGFGFYVENLTRALQKITGPDQFELLYPDQLEDLTTPQRLWWDQVTISRLARKKNVDLLHQPAFSAPILYSGKKIVTIHDVISLFYSNIPFFSRQYYSKWMPFSYHFADHFITISHHSKNDIVSKLTINPDRITVINLAADVKYHLKPSKSDVDKVLRKYHISRPYLLNVGTINPRKNLEFLVRVFAEAKQKFNLPHKLIIVGKKGWHYDRLFQLVLSRGLVKDIIFTGYVDDDDKPALYHDADAFLFPSIYEGFGLPPLEAMTCATPVISSNTSSLPEVMGNGGILLDPTNEASWIEAIGGVLTNKSLASELATKGRRQAASFSWDRCAKETLDVYRRVCHSKS